MTLQIRGYHLIRSENNTPALRANGGVAIGYKPTIPHRLHPAPPMNLDEHLIATLYFQNLYITLLTIYVRPGLPIPLPFFQYISDNIKPYIIIVDPIVNEHNSQTL